MNSTDVINIPEDEKEGLLRKFSAALPRIIYGCGHSEIFFLPPCIGADCIIILQHCLQCRSPITKCWVGRQRKHSLSVRCCCNKAAAKAIQVASPHCLQLVWRKKV